MAEPEATQKRPGRRRVFALVAVVMVLGVFELVGQLAYRHVSGRRYRITELAAPSWEALPRVGPETASGPLQRLVGRQPLHPYVGFVWPTLHPETHGFASVHQVVQAADPARWIVAVTGGSVAGQLSPAIEELLRRRLAESGIGLEPVVVGLNVPGFKQPQQLLSVSYLLSLGGHFDVVVNVDGYNEIALPAKDNYAHHTFPFFPRLWKTRLEVRTGRHDPLVVGEIAFLRRKIERMASVRTGPWRHSALFGLAHRWRRARLLSRAVALEEELTGLASTAGTLETDGPYREYETLDELYADSVEVWRRTSLLLARMAAANGFEYFHFLQPNQYVEGSKTLSAEERRVAWQPQRAAARHVRAGYPLMIEAGEELRAAGVRYTDASRLFRARTETLYQDVCCHYNERGVDLMATRVVDTVLAETTDPRLRRP